MADEPFLIGIGGGSGAGKSTIATEISRAVDAELTLLSLDNYYEDRSDLTVEEREALNFDHPDAIDWDRLVDDLGALARGETVRIPQYDFERHTRTQSTESVDPEPIVVLEGIFALFHEEIVDQLDLAIYVETDADVRVLRRLQRDVEERGRTVDGVIDQYLSTVKPMHEQFVAPTKGDADIVIPEGTNPAAIDLLQEKATQEIESRTVAGTSEL
jgi:uridine kinase